MCSGVLVCFGNSTNRFDTIFRTQVKALRRISMLKKEAKLLEIVGRFYIEDNMLD